MSETKKTRNFRQYKLWQDAVAYATKIYKITDRFLDQALGSAYEVETQLIISCNVGYITTEQNNELIQELNLIQKQLTAFIRSLRNSSDSVS